MAFTATDYSPDDLADILAGTRQVLEATLELSHLPRDKAELIAFLIQTLRTDPPLSTEAFIENVAKFWSLTPADAESAVIDLLAMHEEDAGDLLLEDINTLDVIFST